MGAIYAELHVAGHLYRLRSCDYHTHQASDARGRPNEKTRFGLITLVLDVPHDTFLEAWATAPQKVYVADILFKDNAGGHIAETLHIPQANCVRYAETFVQGVGGHYSAVVQLSAIGGFQLRPGGPPNPFIAPAAREHGTPPVATAGPISTRTSSTCPKDVTDMLQLQVDLLCKPQGERARCLDEDSCPVLLEKIAMSRACIAARTTINNRCYGGGDKGHNTAIEQRENSIKRCQARYLSKCAPKPEYVPVNVPVPSQKIPEISDGAAKLTGVALVIFLILTAPFRLSPN